MRIEKIHIDSFMGSREVDIDFACGVNILRGNNESGKSTVAEFIKFMLYGASARGTEGDVSERQRYLSFGESAFGGYMQLFTGKGHFRIDRTVTQTQSGFRESVAVTDLDKKAQVLKGEDVGEALCGVPESVFKKIAYISQDGEAYTGGADLGSAIENLLFSADETVSTDKALKKLDALRVSLLHKNGKGGMIYEYSKERQELEARLEKALGDNKDIIAKEGSLIDTDRRIDENRTEYVNSKKICELYDNYTAYMRFLKLDETRAEIAETTGEISRLESAFDGFIPDGEYLGRLRQTAEQVQTLAMSAAEETVIEDTESDGLKETAKKAAGARGLSKLFVILGTVLLVASVVLSCVVFLMKLDSAIYIGAGAAAALGAVLIFAGAVRTGKLKATLGAFGVENESELSERAKELDENASRTRDALANAREKENTAAALLENEEKRLADMRAAFTAEAKRVGRDGDDRELFAFVENYISQLSTLSQKRKVLSDRAAQLERDTSAYDRDAVDKLLGAVGDLSIFEKVDIGEYRRKRDFCETAISALEIKKGELEKSLAALRATAQDPALIKASLNELCKKEKEANTKYAAAELAIRSIGKASSGLRTRISPRLAEYAGKLMGVMTDGKYTELGVDGEISLTYLAKGGAHDAAYLSKGTREGAYFALRLALADLLCKEEKLPLILDECFAHADDVRTKQMMRILMALASDNTQSLILTCHTRDEKIADTVGVYNLIEM